MVEINKKLERLLYSHTTKDSARPAFNGVCNTDGFKVATDAHSLLAVRTDYCPLTEGDIILKNGDTVDANFPKWKNIIATGGNTLIKYPELALVDPDKLRIAITNIEDAIKEAKAIMLDPKAVTRSATKYVRLGATHTFKLEIAKRLLACMDQFKDCRILLNTKISPFTYDKNRLGHDVAPIIMCNDDYVAMFMPVSVDGNDLVNDPDKLDFVEVVPIDIAPNNTVMITL